MSSSRPYYYLGGNWALTQLSTGHPFFVNTNDRGITTWIILGGTWENFVDDILSVFVQPGMTIVDVGANMGYYTIKLGSICGSTGRVFAFEPNPELIDFILRNIEINGFSDRCVLFPAAAGAASGQAELTFPYWNMGGGFLRLEGEPAYERLVQVDVVSIDDSLRDVAHVDLFKIDAEGYEPLVLAGATETIARSPRCALLLEISLAAWERFGRIEDLIKPIANSRRIFAVTHATQLVALDVAGIRTYLNRVPTGMAYFFLCSQGTAAQDRLQRFLAV